jgi:hypothetical protein
MSKNLIIEHSLFEGKIKEDQNGKFLVKGVLQRADAANQNNRIYPMHILQRESKKYETLIKERRALGELDHPESTIINLKNVSHNIVEMYWEDKDLCGVVEVLSTPSGNILKELFKNNIRLGISSRGLGSVKPNKDDTVLVQEDFELIGFDFVSNPSTHGAFLSPTNMNESVKKEIDECGRFCRSQDLMRQIIEELN